MGSRHVRKHVSERDLNPHGCDLRRCSPGSYRKQVIAGQRHAFVSEDQGLPIGHGGVIALTSSFAVGGARGMPADRVIRWMTAVAVIGVAAVAAIASYEHAHDLVRAHVRRDGQPGWCR